MAILITWIIYIVCMAFWTAHKMWRKNVARGYAEETSVEFYGGLKEGFGCTIGGAVGLLISPVFLIIHSPALLVMWLVSRFVFNN